MEEKACLYYNEKEMIDLLHYLPPNHSTRKMIFDAGCNIFRWYNENNQIFDCEKKHIGNI